ncbi:MAG: hypothetical protein ACREAU_00170 [Nitrosopumilaceae archaeon]
MNTLFETMRRLAELAGAPPPKQTVNEVTVNDYLTSTTQQLLPTLQKAYDELTPEQRNTVSFGEFVKHAMDGVHQGLADEIAAIMQKIQTNPTPSGAQTPPPEQTSQEEPIPREREKPLALDPIAKKMELVPKDKTPKMPTQRIRSDVAPRKLPPVRSGGERFKRFLGRQVGRISKMTGPGGV